MYSATKVPGFIVEVWNRLMMSFRPDIREAEPYFWLIPHLSHDVNPHVVPRQILLGGIRKPPFANTDAPGPLGVHGEITELEETVERDS